MRDRIISDAKLEPLKRSRKAVKAGDVFALKPEGKDYYIGRVVVENFVLRDIKGLECNDFAGPMVYVYDRHSHCKDDYGDLSTAGLLISPVVVCDALWREGYAETVGHVPLKENDVKGRIASGILREPLLRRVSASRRAAVRQAQCLRTENAPWSRTDRCGGPLHAVGLGRVVHIIRYLAAEPQEDTG